MKKLWRKLLIFPLAGIMAFGVSCSKEEINNELPQEENKNPEREFVTVYATQGRPDTRMAYEEDYDNKGGLKLTWEKEVDGFMLYTNGRYPEIFTCSDVDGHGRGTFTGEVSVEGSEYKAFYPAAKATGTSSWSDLVFDMRGQVQDCAAGKQPTDHLAGVNYMTLNAPLAEVTSGETVFNFRHETAVLKLKLVFPEGVNVQPNKVTLRAGGNNFITQKGVGGSAPQYGDMTLTIMNAPVANELTVYIAILPATIEEYLEYTIIVEEGDEYNCIVTLSEDGFEYKAGYTYVSNVNLTKVDLTEFSNTVAYRNGTAFAEGEGTEDSPYLISSAKELRFLVRMIEEENATYANKHYKLTTDIEVTAGTWTPIGSDEGKPFTGTFNGSGHTISGVLNGDGELSNFGFFGYTENVTITSLTMSAEVAADSERVGGVGGIVGFADGGTIENCVNTRSVTGFSFVGGIAGAADRETIIENCENSGSVESTGAAGGIVGYSGNTIIKNCENSGSVESTDTAGGIAGVIADRDAQLHDCTNNSTNITGNNGVGSIVGWLNQGTVYACCSGSVKTESLYYIGNNADYVLVICTDHSN